MKNILNYKIKIANKKIIVLTSIIYFLVLLFFLNINTNINTPLKEKVYNYDLNEHKNPNISGTTAVNLTLTNGNELNSTRHYHGTNIIIKGIVHKWGALFKWELFVNANVSIMVDGKEDDRFLNKTNESGEFQINYTIQPSLNIYTNHTIEVNLTDPDIKIEYNSYYIISVNTTSFFNKQNPTIQYLTGENFSLPGNNLKYQNGTGISGANVTYYWYYNITSISNGTFLTTSSGAFPGVPIPETTHDELKLKLNYSSIPLVNYSETVFPKIKIFSGMVCTWNMGSTANEGEVFTIQGTLSSSTNASIRIDNRYVNISYNGQSIYIGQTTVNGVFTYTYTLPSGTGDNAIRVDLINDANKQIFVSRFVEIITPAGGAGPAPSPPPEPEPEPVPFQDFFLIFIPIVIGVVAGIGAYGYYRYVILKRRSLQVQVPLEGKINNLKILKESGRLEESLSYLFNAIYMELVGAKYGRKIKTTETIRDFAIISVKEMNLNPASIYPFITKVEEIIYGRPFKIKENDFYDACGLFSPVYFELTGYDFILKF